MIRKVLTMKKLAENIPETCVTAAAAAVKCLADTAQRIGGPLETDVQKAYDWVDDWSTKGRHIWFAAADQLEASRASLAKYENLFNSYSHSSQESFNVQTETREWLCEAVTDARTDSLNPAAAVLRKSITLRQHAAKVLG